MVKEQVMERNILTEGIRGWMKKEGLTLEEAVAKLKEGAGFKYPSRGNSSCAG